MKKEKLTHVVAFRLDIEQWVQLEAAAHRAHSKPNDWVRDLTIEALAKGFGLKPNERILLEQFVRTQYLVAQGFQLLANQKLSTEEWKKIRAYAKEKIQDLTNLALADIRSRKDNGAQAAGSAR